MSQQGASPPVRSGQYGGKQPITSWAGSRLELIEGLWMQSLDDVAARLRQLPLIEPDPAWKLRTKLKLLRLMDEYGKMRVVNRWAIIATYDQDPIDFAVWVRAKGRDWRPVAVDPERLAPAVACLRPNLVVIDSRVPRTDDLARMVRSSSQAETAIANPTELARTA